MGANLGDPVEALRWALDQINSEPGLSVVAVSSVYETAAVGGPTQPSYANAVAIVDSDLEPTAALKVLHRLEYEAGRVRLERWGPRTLDLDIIDVVGLRSDDPTLTLPHPRAAQRAFVLVPLCEIAPNWVFADGTGDLANRAKLLARQQDRKSVV